MSRHIAILAIVESLVRNLPAAADPARGEVDQPLGLENLPVGHMLTFEMQVAGVRKGMEEARNLARKALAIDSGIAEAHAMLAVVKTFYDWDFEGAEREFRLALETNSSSGLACTYFAGLLELLNEPFPRSRTGVLYRRDDGRVDHPARSDQSLESHISHV